MHSFRFLFLLGNAESLQSSMNIGKGHKSDDISQKEFGCFSAFPVNIFERKWLRRNTNEQTCQWAVCNSPPSGFKKRLAKPDKGW